MRQTPILIALAAAFLAAGCGQGAKYVPVSGRVTVNGKPAGDLHVQFNPVATTGTAADGYGSHAVTDADGRYTLKVSSQQVTADGALVGRHRVAFGTRLKGEGGEFTGPSEDGLPLEKNDRERIPPEYNERTTVTFTVPAGGTESADFDLNIPGYERR